jgi:hypothetical protein
MPYGAGRRLGDTVRPELGAYDYSGVERAGQSLGQGFADIGQGLKQRSNEKKQIEKSLKLAKDIGELIPELQPQTTEAIKLMADPDRSHRDQLAIAEGIKDTLQLGLMKQDQDFKREELALRRAAIAARGAGRQESSTIVDPATHEWLLQQTAAGKAKFSSVPVEGGNYKISPVMWTSQNEQGETWTDLPKEEAEAIGATAAQRSSTGQLRILGEPPQPKTDAAERDAQRWTQVNELLAVGTPDAELQALAIANVEACLARTGRLTTCAITRQASRSNNRCNQSSRIKAKHQRKDCHLASDLNN